jgi:hypothetical protein
MIGSLAVLSHAPSNQQPPRPHHVYNCQWCGLVTLSGGRGLRPVNGTARAYHSCLRHSSSSVCTATGLQALAAAGTEAAHSWFPLHRVTSWVRAWSQARPVPCPDRRSPGVLPESHNGSRRPVPVPSLPLGLAAVDFDFGPLRGPFWRRSAPVPLFSP